MNLIIEYLERARLFERMAADAENVGLKEELLKQSEEYLRLAEQRAVRKGLPMTSPLRASGPRLGADAPEINGRRQTNVTYLTLTIDFDDDFPIPLHSSDMISACWTANLICQTGNAARNQKYRLHRQFAHRRRRGACAGGADRAFA